MENRRAIIIALICFGVSIALINGYVRARRYEMTSEFGEELYVVVAANLIDEYSIIRGDNLKAVPIFKKYVQPQSIVVTGTDLSREPAVQEIVGKAAYVPIYENEQITLTKLINQDGKPVLDRQVEKKMRAVTVQIAPHTGVGRLIRPGNRVDILATINYDQSGTTIFETKTVVQNVLVLATGKHIQNSVPTGVNRNVLSAIEEEMDLRRRKDFGGGSMEPLNTSRPDDNYSHITLQLTPEDAEKIMYLSSTFGDQRLYFVLRNGADQGGERLDTTLLDEVLGPDSDYGQSKRKLPPPSPPSPPRYFDIIGGQVVPKN